MCIVFILSMCTYYMVYYISTNLVLIINKYCLLILNLNTK